MHNFFVLFNAAIGLLFLRRANRELFGAAAAELVPERRANAAVRHREQRRRGEREAEAEDESRSGPRPAERVAHDRHGDQHVVRDAVPAPEEARAQRATVQAARVEHVLRERERNEAAAAATATRRRGRAPRARTCRRSRRSRDRAGRRARTPRRSGARPDRRRDPSRRRARRAPSRCRRAARRSPPRSRVRKRGAAATAHSRACTSDSSRSRFAPAPSRSITIPSAPPGRWRSDAGAGDGRRRLHRQRGRRGAAERRPRSGRVRQPRQGSPRRGAARRRPSSTPTSATASCCARRCGATAARRSCTWPRTRWSASRCADPAKYYANNVGNGLAPARRDARAGDRRSSCSRRPSRSTASRASCRSRSPIRPIPINPYGETKLAFERALRWYERRLRPALGEPALLQRGRRDANARASDTIRRRT